MNKNVKWLFWACATFLISVVFIYVFETTYNVITEIITEPLEYGWYEINPPVGEEGRCFMVIIEPTFLQRYYRRTVACTGSLREATNMDYSEVMWDEFDYPGDKGPCYGIIYEFEAFKVGQGVGPSPICP